MDFPHKLAAMRKQKGLSQQALANLIDLHVIQISRYETGSSQPTLDVIRKLATVMIVKAVLEALILRHEARRWSATPSFSPKVSKSSKAPRASKASRSSKV